MARRKKKKLSDEETDQLIDQWISSIEDLREFFFEHAPEEEGDVFYDRFLEKFQIVENLFHDMVEHEMIVQDDGQKEVSDLKEVKELEVEPKQTKGIRRDN